MSKASIFTDSSIYSSLMENCLGTAKIIPTTMRSTIFLVALLVSFSSFSQEKNVNKNEMMNRLSSIQLEIEKLDEKLILINQRLAELPEGYEVEPSEFSGFEKMKTERQKLSSIAYSLESYLSGNSDVQPDIKIITKAEFDRYPDQNKKQILAHPDRYLVLGL